MLSNPLQRRPDGRGDHLPARAPSPSGWRRHRPAILTTTACALAAALAAALVVSAGQDGRPAAPTPGTASQGLTPGTANRGLTPGTAGRGSTPGTASQGLTPGTLAAFVAARTAMRAEGIELRLTSGYRSPRRQQQLFDEAVARYGSPEAARVWVLPPQESQHVRGVAVDVAPREAARWLDEHGARFGLCRTMEWEWWHFEHHPTWERTRTCPPPRRR